MEEMVVCIMYVYKGETQSADNSEWMVLENERENKESDTLCEFTVMPLSFGLCSTSFQIYSFFSVYILYWYWDKYKIWIFLKKIKKI